MSYIGKTPTVGNFQVCDAISVVNGQAAYTMQVDSVNVVPESANHMLVSLNGILQKPGSSFTVSGSTITFASNLSTGDVIDFITLLGNVLDLGTPSDATVTNAKTNFTSTSSAAGLQIKGDGTTDGTLQLNCSQNTHGVKLASPAHSAGQSYTLTLPTGNVTADKVLKVASVSGSGATGIGQLSFASAGGITEADAFRISANQNGDSEPITGNIERVDDATFAKIGTGMSESSGIFTFPSTGLYYITFTFSIQLDANNNNSMICEIVGTANNSSYDTLAEGALSGETGNHQNQQCTISTYFNCTNTSTHKVRFDVNSMNDNNLKGSTSETKTGFTFIRLGDSQ
jgi:hypothetical protein